MNVNSPHLELRGATAVATGGAAMGIAVATGGLPWVVSTGIVASITKSMSFRKVGCTSGIRGYPHLCKTLGMDVLEEMT